MGLIAKVVGLRLDRVRDDGLEDGREVDEFGSDPFDPDSDGDTLTDGDEVYEHGTDPTDADTDGGTIDDGTEVPLSRTHKAAFAARWGG